MGLIGLGSTEDYRAALRSLFPRGEFWDRQFEDAESDTSLWCAAQVEELSRFKTRMADLGEESILGTTSELIDDWERVAGVNNDDLNLDRRRRILQETKMPNLSPGALQNVAAPFGAAIVRISLPFRPAFFGFSRFASRLATAGAWNVIYLYIDLTDDSLRDKFESSIESVLLSTYTTIFFYKAADNEYVPG